MSVAQHEKVMIMAGGTGGHVFPALAVAQQLRQQGVEVIWLGTRRGLEARVVPEAGFPIEFISVSGLRGKGALGWFLAPARLVFALWQALLICRRQQPHSVLGMGGFASGPGGVAAWFSRRPLVIQEQNAAAGLTNRLLSHLARRVLEGFEGSFPRGIQAEQTGNPVRQAIRNLAGPDERFAARQGAIRLLVIGGSLGAQALNQTLPEAVSTLANDSRPQIRHQAGRDKDANTRSAYAQAGVEAEVTDFIEDMAEAYAWADVVVCRAGALTISELATVGLGAILVPYPHAVDDHQTHNARQLAEHGAARLLPQSEMTPAVLAKTLAALIDSGRSGLLNMARAARTLARPQASERVAEVCLEVMHG